MSLSQDMVIAGKYRLLHKLGSGAMGAVWAARNLGTDREVALKLLMPGADAEIRRRLLREAKAYGRLKNRYIVEIYDVAETESGDPFLVMPLLHGETLADRLRRDKVLPVEEAVRIACDVTSALKHAHERSVVHRDLKPANIFLHVDEEGGPVETKVVDFGVSKLAIENEGASTMAGSVLGSPAYMSPEQARALKTVDGRTDLWSLGVVLFEMLTGQRPFKGMNAVHAIGQILHAPIPRVESLAPHVNARLGDVIAACMTRDVDQRVASAAELLRLLRPFGPRDQFGTYQSGMHDLGRSTDDARSPFASSGSYEAPPQAGSRSPIVPSHPSSSFRAVAPPVREPPPVASMQAPREVRPIAPPPVAPPPADEPSRDSLVETVMRPGLSPTNPRPDPDSWDSGAPTGMFNPSALIEQSGYEDRGSFEPTGVLDLNKAQAIAAHEVQTESSRPTAEIIYAPGGASAGTVRVAPLPARLPDDHPLDGTIPIQEGYRPPSPAHARGVPPGPPAPGVPRSSFKTTMPLQQGLLSSPFAKDAPLLRPAPGPPPAPPPPSFPTSNAADATMMLASPLDAAGTTSTSPVAQPLGFAPPMPMPIAPMAAPLVAPKPSRLPLILILVSVAVTLISLTVVAIVLRGDKAGHGVSAAGSASASAPSPKAPASAAPGATGR